MINITTFKTKVEGKLHGTTLAKVADFYGKLHEAAGNVLLRLDPPTTKRRARIENAIYDRVYNYVAPSDIKGEDAILDIRPLGERSSSDDIGGTYGREFDIKKRENTVAIEHINGAKTLRLSKVLTPRTTLHRCDSLTLEGTVTGGGDVQNLETDELDFISGNASIKFGLSGSTGTGTITIALDNEIDLEDLEDLGALFEWLKFPDIDRLTSVKLEWGSSSTVYWHKTVTAAHDRSFADVGDDAWMLLRHDWSSATEVGSPDSDDAAAIDYLKITITYTAAGGALAGVRLDNITAALGEAWEAVYYSGSLFRSSAGTWKEIPTDDSDIIQLDVDGINILLYEFMTILTQEIKGKNMAADLAAFERKLEGDGKKPGLYELYEQKYPSEAVPRSTTYGEFDALDGYGDGGVGAEEDWT